MPNNPKGQAMLDRLVELHVETVEVIGAKHAPCAHQRWAGKVLSVEDDGSGKPTLVDAVADGLLGDGCEHDIAVVLDLG